jgi:hypothetical protein
MNERKNVVEFLRSTANHWRRVAIRLHRNETAVLQCDAKANVLDSVALDIESGLHEIERNRL